LGIDRVSIHDNFFNIGGHSLLAIRVLSRLKRVFQIQLNLRQLFQAPSIAELAVVIEDMLIEEVNALTDEEAEKLLHNGDRKHA